MYSICDPDEYETTTTVVVCPTHKMDPKWKPFPSGSCGCGGHTTQRRRSPDEILKLRAERKRKDEDAIIQRADEIRAARGDFSRVKQATDIAIRFGGIDGAHHKDWVIDQMVRALTGCPVEKRTAKDCNGVEYEYEALGESAEYTELVRAACEGEDGPETYSWNTGITP